MILTNKDNDFQDCLLSCTVLICTRNRHKQLAQTLESISLMNIPSGLLWEVIVVDNGSTDETSETVKLFEDKLPIKRVIELKAGLSNARNAGVAAAQGKYIIWTDDDVIVDRNWLEAYVQAFKRWPECEVFGGKVRPVLEPPTPLWFKQHETDLSCLVARREFGEKPVRISIEGDFMPYGANYAIRSDAQKRYKYNPDVGVAPGRRMGGEETDLITEILASGGTGWWIHNAVVNHIIPAERQTKRYVFTYYSGIGERAAYCAIKEGQNSFLPLLVFRTIICFLLYHALRLTNHRLWFPRLKRYGYRWGELKYRIMAKTSERNRDRHER